MNTLREIENDIRYSDRRHPVDHLEPVPTQEDQLHRICEVLSRTFGWVAEAATVEQKGLRAPSTGPGRRAGVARHARGSIRSGIPLPRQAAGHSTLPQPRMASHQSGVRRKLEGAFGPLSDLGRLRVLSISRTLAEKLPIRASLEYRHKGPQVPKTAIDSWCEMTAAIVTWVL